MRQGSVPVSNTASTSKAFGRKPSTAAPGSGLHRRVISMHVNVQGDKEHLPTFEDYLYMDDQEQVKSEQYGNMISNQRPNTMQDYDGSLTNISKTNTQIVQSM